MSARVSRRSQQERDERARARRRTLLDLALEDRHEADDAPERVVPAVKHQPAEGLLVRRRRRGRSRRRGRDALDDASRTDSTPQPVLALMRRISPGSHARRSDSSLRTASPPAVVLDEVPLVDLRRGGG